MSLLILSYSHLQMGQTRYKEAKGPKNNGLKIMELGSETRSVRFLKPDFLTSFMSRLNG